MSAAASAHDPLCYAHDPPPYDDPDDDEANKTVQPTIHVLSGQSIHAESADAAPLYQLTRGVAKLTYATSEVEVSRVDRAVRTDSGEPTIQQRAYRLYNIRHIGVILGSRHAAPSEAPPFFVEARSKRVLGSFGLKKSRFRSHWKALPIKTKGNTRNQVCPAFVKDAKPLFEVRQKDGRYEWTDADGNAVAVEDAGEEQYRLLMTVCMHQDTADALVALWCCRLWQCNAENEEAQQSSVDSFMNKMNVTNDLPTMGWLR